MQHIHEWCIYACISQYGWHFWNKSSEINSVYVVCFTSALEWYDLGHCKEEKIRDYYGSGWVGPDLNLNFFVCEKPAQNGPKPVLIFWSSRPLCHVYSVCIYIAKSCWLLWFECPVNVSDGFPKKKSLVGGGWVGWALSKFFWDFFNFTKPLTWVSATVLNHLDVNCSVEASRIEVVFDWINPSRVGRTLGL